MRGLEYYLHDIMHAGNDGQEQQGKGELLIYFLNCVSKSKVFVWVCVCVLLYWLGTEWSRIVCVWGTALHC